MEHSGRGADRAAADADEGRRRKHLTVAQPTMRILIDVGDSQLHELDELSKQEKRSRAALIREAIDDFLAKRRSKHQGDAFGLWGKRKVDGLVYQERVRSEW
jgi:predicted transcriptional regulator